MDRKKQNEKAVTTIGRAPGSPDGNPDEILELLDQVKLTSFKATPAVLQPFESSHLRWQVEAPARVRIRLDGTTVANSGSNVVQPLATQVFRLYAYIGQYSRFLASVTVSVNVNQCTSRDVTTVDELFSYALTRGVEEDGEVYFRVIEIKLPYRTQYVQSAPKVTMSPGRIRFQLELEGKVAYVPNPSIDVDGSFGLALAPSSGEAALVLSRTEIVPIGVDVSVQVTFPWYAYLIPGANIGLPIAASMAADRARASFTNAVSRFVAEGIDPVFAHLAPPGMQAHSVRIYTGDYGGTVEVDFCPALEPEVVLQ